MKDPLQKQQSPYEILGVGRDATAPDIDQAFKRGLMKRIPVQKLTQAKVALERPAERAVLDALHYDDDVLARLTPNPLADGGALGSARRAETARAWEAQLRRAFPDAGIIHALAVLSYWDAINASEEGAASAAESWRTAIGYWAALIANDEFWKTNSFSGAVHDRIAADIHRCAQVSGELAKLELTFKNEIRVAKALAAADIRANRGRLTCGALMLERMGLIDKIRAQVENALQVNPGNSALVSLLDALSPFSSIAAMIDAKQYDAALAEIERLPEQQRSSKEIGKLKATALFEKGKQQASLGNLDAALELWGKALSKAGTEESQKQIHDELVNTVQSKAAALQNRQPDDAIALLERALKVIRSQKLELTLAEILTMRGVGTILEAQKRVEKEQKGGPEIIEAIEKGLVDLERAAKLGSKRAEEQATIAKNILASMKGGFVAVDLPSGAQSLLQQASSAAEKKEWTTAIDLLRKALDQTSYNSEAARTIKKHLSTMLVNRAIGAVNIVMTMMQGKDQKSASDLQLFVKVLDSARKDLREAKDLDPSSDYARDNLREIDEMLSNLGPLADVARDAAPVSPFDSPFDSGGFGPLTPSKGKKAKPVRASGDRRTAHAVIVGALVVLAMIVALANQKGLYETRASIWLNHQVSAIRDGSVPGHIAYIVAKVLGWPAWFATMIMFIGSWVAIPGAYLYGVVCGTAWRQKDPFAKLLEFAVWAFALLFITGAVIHATKPSPAAAPEKQIAAKAARPKVPVPVPVAVNQSAPANAPRTPPPAPPTTAPQTDWLRADVVSTPAVLKTLQTIASEPVAAARQRAEALASPAVSAAARAAAWFCAAAAYERGGDLANARTYYERVVGSDSAAFKRSAEFRLAAIDGSDAKLREEKFRSYAKQNGGEGLFYVSGGWTQSTTQHAALQSLMDLRADKKSIRLFNYLRAKSFFPAPYAYLFILLALALAIKLLSLPFLVHGAKVSLAIPRLRGEYQRLKAQYSGDALGFSSAVTALYKRHGINPSAGCAKIAIDIGFVVWVMLTLRNFAPQLTLDGAKFLWTSNVTERDIGVLVMWVAAGMLMLFLTPQMEQGQTAQLACASLAILGIIAGAAWYWSWPAYLMIFWTVLSLLTAIVHFVTIGVLATRS